MTHTLETIRHALSGGDKGPVLGLLFSASLGLGAEAMGATGHWNTVVIVALCGATGAFFANLHKIILAISGSRSVLAKELRLLLARTHRLEQRVVLEQAAKHAMQSENNNLVILVMNLEAMLIKAGIPAPEFKIKNYDQLLGETDKEIKALMLKEGEEE